MKLDDIQIIKLEKDFKDSESFLDYYNYRRLAWEELYPEIPILKFEDFKNEWMTYSNDTSETLMYALKHEDNFIGNYYLSGIKISCESAPQAEKENGYFQCFVPIGLRRQRIGTLQLKKVVKLAKEWGFKKLFCIQCEKEPAKEFCRHFGGTITSKDTSRIFFLKDAVWNKIESFSHPSIRNADFTTEFIIGSPQDLKDGFVRFYANLIREASNFVNEEPLDEDFLVKEMQEDEGKRKDKEINILAIAKDSEGRFAGATEVTIRNFSPEFAFQGITGVAKDFRGNGLGLRLKAEMALHIRDNYPKVEKISTITSNENKWMIGINEAIGYKVYKQVEKYRFDVAELLNILGENNEY